MTRYFLSCLLCCNLAWAAEPADRHYDVTFSADFQPERHVVEAHIKVAQATHMLRLLDLYTPDPEFSGFVADGSFKRTANRLQWNVPAEGGTLTYKVRIDHERGKLMDARMTRNWAILRLDDVFPAARVRSRTGAISRSLLELHGPPGWHLETRYGTVDGPMDVGGSEQRRFVRPTGWMAAGKLGVRRELIAQRKVSVAAPVGQGMRRMDMLAFLRWTLPHLVKLFPDFPDRLLIVGARDQMWHGGLSGPGSVYLYADLPLISENATSPLLHELVHVATGSEGKKREDWIIEGLAEYYGLEILRRSGGISKKRFRQAMQQLGGWANRENGKLVSPSSGADTARAVLLFYGIQRELKQHEAGSLDSIVRKLMAAPSIDRGELLNLVEAKLGSRSDSLRQALNLNPAPAN